MFGSGKYGILGIGNEKAVSYTDPAEVTYFTERNIPIKDVALGEDHSVFLSDKGEVYTCGYAGDSGLFSFFQTNKAGALGHGDKLHLGRPKKVAFFEQNGLKVKQISAGRYHTVALTEGGQVYAWGRGSYGTLGNGRKSPRLLPTLVGLLEDYRKDDPMNEIIKIDSADFFTVALSKGGDVFTWGENGYGQMGVGAGAGIDLVESESYPTPVDYDKKVNVVDMACGNRTLIMVDDKGDVYKAGMKFDYSPSLFDIPKDFEVGKVKGVFCGDQHYTILYGTVGWKGR